MIEFKAWPKIPRLFRDVIITEKIDGTNAAIHIEASPFGTHVDGVPPVATAFVLGPENEGGTPDVEYLVGAQSRKRLITPGDDNYGFAAWVFENAPALVEALGEGTHYGEWWGYGIQRGYGVEKGDRRFSLFNTHRHAGIYGRSNFLLDHVPVLYQGPFRTSVVDQVLDRLERDGSAAQPGYDRPEGVVVYHEAARHGFKVLLENDDRPKSAVADEAA